MPLTCITTPHPNLNAHLDEHGILTLSLNRPERKNALFGEFYLALENALLEADQDDAVRVVLLRGEDDFSAGNDLNDFVNSPASSTDAPPFRVLRAAAILSKPLVIAVKGVAIGIGTTLLLHADLVYADPATRFQMPFLTLGLTPEGGSTLLLPQRAGYLKAAELLLLADLFNAETALQAGLVNQIVADDVYAHAYQRALRLSALPRETVKTTKALLRGNTSSVVTAINQEAEHFVARMGTPAMHEAIAAFKEKRKPDFRQFD